MPLWFGQEIQEMLREKRIGLPRTKETDFLARDREEVLEMNSQARLLRVLGAFVMLVAAVGCASGGGAMKVALRPVGYRIGPAESGQSRLAVGPGAPPTAYLTSQIARRLEGRGFDVVIRDESEPAKEPVNVTCLVSRSPRRTWGKGSRTTAFKAYVARITVDAGEGTPFERSYRGEASREYWHLNWSVFENEIDTKLTVAAIGEVADVLSGEIADRLRGDADGPAGSTP